MRTVAVKLLTLAAAGALLYGGFVAYERWWDGDLSLVQERVLSFINDRAEDVKERAVEAGGEALQSAKEEATEAAKGAIASVVGGIIESVGERIQHFGESVAGTPAAETVPAALGPTFAVPPPPVALTAQVDAPLTFAVNEGVSYAVSWGDGATHEGEKDVDATVLVSHVWTLPGDYVVTLTTKLQEREHAVTFPIRIYE
ncbi:MAG: hypothetical protein Q8P88_03010 [Candidatus Jorgensenbacteria bacterium]|nr:hypothetical protein [Candidatus Jorgensenbacteria bacterium]